MKKLGTIKIIAVTVPVVQTTPEEVGDSTLLCDTDHATYDHDDNTIRVNAESKKADLKRDNVSHEYVHALLDLSGVRQYLRQNMRCSNEEWENHEEVIARMLGPAIHSSYDAFTAVMNRIK